MPHVPGYDLVAVVGEGGSATLWRAVPAGGGAQVAVKLGHAATSYARERFAAEAAALREVGPPHTPQLHAAGETADRLPFLVMELFENGTLDDQLAALTAPPAPGLLRALAEPLAIALAAIHHAGLIHRDLKPANVFTRPGPNPVCAVADFGLALEQGGGDRLTRPGVGVGTPHYVAPEQLAGGDVDHRADLYSFGVILYRMATLQLPFDGTADAIEYGHRALRPPPPSRRAPVGRQLEQLIADCLAKEPAMRPPSALAVRDRLVTACTDAVPTVSTRPRALRRSRPPVVPGREPVALVVLDTDAGALGVVERLARRGGSLITQTGRRYVFGFLAGDDERPIDAAIASAREIAAELSIPVAVDLDDAIVRRQGVTPLIYSERIDDPGAIAPPVPGVALTARAAQVASGEVEPHPDAAGWFRIAAPALARGSRRAIPLIGRDDIVSGADASFAACCLRARPSVWLMVGDAGSGRTRLCRELADRIRATRPDARVIEVSARDDREVAAAAGRARDEATAQPVALIVDDLHRASNRALDLLDYAALDASGVTLWLAGAAGPRLDQLRPHWGAFAAHRERVELGPLSESDAVDLVAALLAPADYPARAVLRGLAAWAGHRPGPLEELVRALVREGHVRPRERGEGHYLALPDLEALTRAPIAQWLAARELADLVPPLAELLEICSALDAPFTRREVEAIQLALAGDDAGNPLIDAGVGLEELRRRGALFTPTNLDFAFRSSLVARGVYGGIEAERRAAIHRAAAEQEPGSTGSIQALARRARHAEHAGDPVAATGALLALGQAQLAAHRDADASSSFDRAVDAAPDQATRATALVWRGKARTRIDRLDDALTDLGVARDLARALGDRALETEALLEQAAARDWVEQFSEADDARREAEAVRDGLIDPRLDALAVAARGRSHWRMDRFAEAVADLDLAAELGRRAGCYDAEVVAATVGPLALLRLGRVDEARARFSRSVSLFETRGDQFHLAAVLVNRMFLWSAIDERENGRDDLRRAIALARELGQPHLERGGLYNLAEDLHWSGEPEQALALAERSLVLQQHYFPGALRVDALLLARIRAAEGDAAGAQSLVADIDSNTGQPSFDLLREAVDAAIRGIEPAAWIALCDRAERALTPDEALEVRYFAARSLQGDARHDHLVAAKPLLARYRIWRRRFEQLGG